MKGGFTKSHKPVNPDPERRPRMLTMLEIMRLPGDDDVTMTLQSFASSYNLVMEFYTGSPESSFSCQVLNFSTDQISSGARYIYGGRAHLSIPECFIRNESA